MAKKHKGKKSGAARGPVPPKNESAAPKPAKAVKPPTVIALPAPEPRFWFGFEIAWAKLLVVRVVLFGMLAIDALLQIRHAPRYGAGGFNVAQIPGLEALGPSREVYEVAQLVAAYLFVLAALGVATRWVLPAVTAIYAWLYFTSQLDGYQHHYLMVLILGISCFVPWQRRADTTAGTPVRTWAVRLILVQLGILYAWAAISKMNAAWTDGRTLANQITGPLRAVVDSAMGVKAAAKLTIVAELVLAFTVWVRPAWFIALPLGVAFHVGILLSGLEIGLFAWLMLGLYLLLVPDRVFVWLAAQEPLVIVRRIVSGIRLDGDARTGIALAAGVALAIGAARLCRFEHAFVVAIALVLVPIAGVIAMRRFGGRGAVFGIAHLVAILVWLAVDRASSVAVDYYRFWGGSSRRLGDVASSERAYRTLVALQPDEGQGHYQLGRLLIKRGEETEGLAELRRAQAEEPSRARAYVAEAEYLAGKGRTAEALAKAQEATYAEPESAEAKRLVDRLSKPDQPAAPSAPTADDDREAP